MNGGISGITGDRRKIMANLKKNRPGLQSETRQVECEGVVVRHMRVEGI